MKEKVLMYRIGEHDKNSVRDYFKSEYEVIDEDGCFTDILAIPAAVIFMNPQELEDDEIAQLNELFVWDSDTVIVFTEKPDDLESIRFEFCYEDDLDRLRNEIFMPTGCAADEDIDPEYEREMRTDYDDAVASKNRIIRDIDQYIMPDDLEQFDQVLCVRQREEFFRSAYDLLHHREDLKGNERTAYRLELMDIMIAMKLAYGMLDEDDVIFNETLGERTIWILRLAGILQDHKEKYPWAKRGSRYLNS